MARSPALLLLLTLGLCEYGHRAGCPGIHGTRYQMKVGFRGSTHPQMGKQLELECGGAEKDYGVSWIRQDKDGALHFIVFISSMSKATFQQNEQARFEVRKHGTSYQLVVKSFKAQDEGKYFCVLNKNQMLHFSSGQPAFLPVTTTAAPTTAEPTTQHGTTKNYTCLKTPDSETNKWDFFCDIFIWIPLTGACLLLLIALVITVLLCQRARTRRCRCKR
ncbi:T-cell surface glycoprotein CD8 alpha chain [Buceros rhinoceros silvestris]|uniref:T-cell surface glycoprotein CD8 alpha chain n=1 Tax=Buceros rhinoceros silvestris TaxID=175836 RepID=A0A091H888_BUCRH|nr:T-cell surface glycoprotein CD8 alpha chain [Buceros rhinoceros silvestris]